MGPEIKEILTFEEWVVLLKEAKKVGITIEEIKKFLKGANEDEKRSSGKIC